MLFWGGGGAGDSCWYEGRDIAEKIHNRRLIFCNDRFLHLHISFDKSITKRVRRKILITVMYISTLDKTN